MIGNTIKRLPVRLSPTQSPIDYKFRVIRQARSARLTPQIKRELRRAIEPVISYLKAEHRMGANYLRTVQAMPLTPCWPPPL